MAKQLKKICKIKPLKFLDELKTIDHKKLNYLFNYTYNHATADICALFTRLPMKFYYDTREDGIMFEQFSYMSRDWDWTHEDDEIIRYNCYCYVCMQKEYMILTLAYNLTIDDVFNMAYDIYCKYDEHSLPVSDQMFELLEKYLQNISIGIKEIEDLIQTPYMNNEWLTTQLNCKKARIKLKTSTHESSFAINRVARKERTSSIAVSCELKI